MLITSTPDPEFNPRLITTQKTGKNDAYDMIKGINKELPLFMPAVQSRQHIKQTLHVLSSEVMLAVSVLYSHACVLQERGIGGEPHIKVFG